MSGCVYNYDLWNNESHTQSTIKTLALKQQILGILNLLTNKQNGKGCKANDPTTSCVFPKEKKRQTLV